MLKAINHDAEINEWEFLFGDYDDENWEERKKEVIEKNLKAFFELDNANKIRWEKKQDNLSEFYFVSTDVKITNNYDAKRTVKAKFICDIDQGVRRLYFEIGDHIHLNKKEDDPRIRTLYFKLTGKRFKHQKELDTETIHKEKQKMKIIAIDNNGRTDKAVFFNELPRGNELEKLVNILTDRSQIERGLLLPVTPKSVPDDMGAEHILFLAIGKLPEGGFGVGGIYGVSNWIVEHLDKAMPEGMGAALTQPMIFDLKNIETEEWTYIIVISPMDRTKTDKKGLFLSDPHDNDAPPIIYHS